MKKKVKRILYFNSAVNVGVLILVGGIGSMLHPWRVAEAFFCVFLAFVGVVFNITETIVLTTEDDSTGG